MEILIALSAFFLICTAIEAKKIEKCLDTDGRVYRIGQGYETNCTQFTCQEIGPKLEMVASLSSYCCWDNGQEYEIGQILSTQQVEKVKKCEIGPKLEMVASLSSYCCWDNGQEYEIGQILSTQQVEKVKKCESVEGKATLTDETMYGKYCVYEEKIIPVGEKLPLTDICSFMTCEFISINATKRPSLKLEMDVKPPGAGCCLGEDGDNMFREGVNRTLESGLEATCHVGNWETINKNFNLVLTGGEDDEHNYLSSSELMSSDGSCSHNIPQLPVILNGARSVYIKDNLMVCGGGYGFRDYHDSCYKFNSSSSSWTQAAPLNTKRSSFTLTKAGQELYVLGGQSEYWLDTIEKFSGDKWELLSITMTSPRRTHCTVYLESNKSLVVTGGDTNKVEMLDLKTLTWSRMDPLPVPYLLGHECKVLKHDGEDNIYVTGGVSEKEVQSKVWKMSRGTWSLVGEMKQPRSFHSMEILNGSLVVIGGFGETYSPGKLSTVERMDSEGNWETLPTTLSVARSGHAMAAVPAEAFPCIK